MTRMGLDRTAVVNEAAQLSDECGLAAVTMAALAKRLGIALPSLYVHVRNLEHLRQQIAALGSEELARYVGDAVQGRAGFDALAAFATAYRAYALRYPGRYAASQMAPDLTDPRHAAATEQAVRVTYATLRGYGLQEPEATHAVRVLRSSLHGFVSLEREGGFAAPDSIDRSFQRLVEALDRAFSSWPTADGASA